MNLTTLEPTEVARSISHAAQTPGPLIARRLPLELGERRAFDRAMTVVTVSFAAAGVKCEAAGETYQHTLIGLGIVTGLVSYRTGQDLKHDSTVRPGGPAP